MSVKINKIAYYLPGKPINNDEILRIHPDWDMRKLSDKTGIYQRYWADKEQTAFDMSCKACDKLLEEGVDRTSIGGIIYCTQSPDYVMPSNAFLLHNYLGLSQKVFAFDYNLACSGYIYGLAMARGFMATGMAENILLVTADTYSKYIYSKDRSAKILFGDGASATLLTKTEENGVVDIALASSGKDYKSFYIPAGASRQPSGEDTRKEMEDLMGNIRTLDSIHMNGFAVWKFIATTVPNQIKEILSRNSMSVDDIDCFVFHQASKMTLDSLIAALKIDNSKVYSNIGRVGNLVSSSIPVALKDAENEGVLKKGHTLLLSGFGVGLSWGTVILKY